MSKSVAEIFNKRKHVLAQRSTELVLPFAKVGVEVEVEGVKNATPDIPFWNKHNDGSLRGGIEYVTDGGLVGVELVQAIRDACAVFTKQKFTDGWPRAGIHLHIDVTDINEAHPKQLLNFVSVYILCEHVLFGFAGEWRRACGYTDALDFSKGDYRYIAKALTGWDTLDQSELLSIWEGAPADGVYLSKYQAINLLPMATLGTIEFRHLPTTFDAERIIKWINLVLSLKKFALESAEYISPAEIASKLGVEGFFRHVFGEHYDSISKFVDARELWKAMDNVQALVVPGRYDYFFIDEPKNSLIKTKLADVKKPAPGAAKKKILSPFEHIRIAEVNMPRIRQPPRQAQDEGADVPGEWVGVENYLRL